LCNVVAEQGPPINANRALVIGDSLRTDVVFGKTAGYETLLVGTGTSQLSDVEEVIGKINAGDESQELKRMLPDYFVPSLNDFYKKLLE
jgi:ribonucleotide monophosphatase NagD (HAD superfamily)